MNDAEIKREMDACGFAPVPKCSSCGKVLNAPAVFCADCQPFKSGPFTTEALEFIAKSGHPTIQQICEENQKLRAENQRLKIQNDFLWRNKPQHLSECNGDHDEPIGGDSCLCGIFSRVEVERLRAVLAGIKS